MAFVCETQRKLHEPPTGSGLSPGQYDFSPPRVQHSVAPFGGTSPRCPPPARKFVTPGPAAYNVGGQIARPSIEAIANHSSIIIRINQLNTHPFKSQRRRFDSDKEGAAVPGPGSYILSEDRSKIKLKRDRARATNYLQNNSRQRVVSIPERVYKLFKGKDIMDTAEADQSRGPGLYDPVETKPKRGSVWSYDTSKRFQAPKEKEQPGPGQYFSASKPDEKGKQLPSCAFASATSRSIYDQIYYKTNKMAKAQVREQIKFKDQLPGPGYYNPGSKRTQFARFQFFGSTVRRFNQKLEEGPGPGQYDARPAVRKTFQVNIQKQRVFNLGGQRESNLPGPGDYDLPSSFSNDPETKTGGVLGGRVQRFAARVGDCPGPGQYEPLLLPDSRASASFLVKQRQISLGQPTHDLMYDVSQHQIGKRAMKKKQFIQNLKLINVKKPAFDAKDARFKHYEEQEESTRTKHSPSGMLRGRRPSQEQSVSAEKKCFGGSERFPSLAYRGPGVGKYELESPRKRSFNRKYQ